VTDELQCHRFAGWSLAPSLRDRTLDCQPQPGIVVQWEPGWVVRRIATNAFGDQTCHMPPELVEIELILHRARSILVVDWPSRGVPDGLARAGYDVTVHGGPGPLDYARYRVRGEEIEIDRGLSAPEAVDIVYVFRPIDELPALAEAARTMGATTLWYQSGLSDDGTRDPKGCWLSAADSARAQMIATSRGLFYVERPYIEEALSNST
jgi:predicted CoA-binding protein